MTFPPRLWLALGFIAGMLIGTFAAHAAELHGLVRQAVDGDTLVVAIAGSNVRVRLADIDAPEMHGQCPAETDLAQRAKARLKALTEGYWVALTLDTNRPRDTYGRMLATATVARSGLEPRVPVGTLMVAEGLARPWTGRRMPWC